jgi:hypothetical protein
LYNLIHATKRKIGSSYSGHIQPTEKNRLISLDGLVLKILDGMIPFNRVLQPVAEDVTLIEVWHTTVKIVIYRGYNAKLVLDLY